MDEKKHLECLLLRYAPDAVKEEFVNIGVVLVEPGGAFADVRFTKDWKRVRCLDAGADVELLQALESEIRAKIATEGADRDKMLGKILQDSFSGTLQVSNVKAVLAASPEKELEVLAKMYLEPAPRDPERLTREASGRVAIFNAMRDAFRAEGVWELPQMRKRIPVAEYTRRGDPLQIDCGYRPNGVVKLLHAVALIPDPDSAKVLAYSYPQIAAGIAKREAAKVTLTAIVEDAGDIKADPEQEFARATLTGAGIVVAVRERLPEIARGIRAELGL